MNPGVIIGPGWHILGWAQVTPVLDPSVRNLCVRPYAGHPHGCPNHGRRATCPPSAPALDDLISLAEPVYAAWHSFDLAGHVTRLRAKHPQWSERQLYCCLYWQGTARRCHRMLVRDLIRRHLTSYLPIYCPEGCGVNVTATMATLGVNLEWPPRTVAYQVAFLGQPVRGEP